MSQKRPFLNTRTMITLAMLAAVAWVVTYLCKALPSVNGFLDFEFKSVIVCIGGFTLGPMAALVLSVLVPVVEFFTISGTGPIGLLMNVLSTAAFSCTACWIYKKYRSMNGAVVGLGVGAVTMTALMLLWNYLITPIYQGVAREVVAAMLVPVFLPFNLVKGGLNMAFTLLLYKPVVTALRKAGLVAPSQSGKGGLFNGAFLLFSLVLLASFVVWALVLLGVI